MKQCEAAGVMGHYVDERGKFVRWQTPLGYALFRRVCWLHDAQERGMTYEEAEAWFDADFERDHEALNQAERERTQAVARATRERENRDEVDAFSHIDKLLGGE